MKFMSLFYVLAIFLLFFQTYCKRLSRKHRHRHSSHFRSHRYLSHNSDFKKSSVYQFLIGLIKEISSDPQVDKAIDECTSAIQGWASVQAETIDEKEKSVGDSNDVKGKFSEGFLTKIIDTCCGFRSTIINGLSRRFRRYRRLFLQGKVKMSFEKWGFSGLWNSIKNAASSVAKAVVSGVKKVGSAVSSAAQWVGKKVGELTAWVKEKLTSVFQPLYEKIKKWFEDKIQKFLAEHPVIKQVIDFTMCFIKNNLMMSIGNLFKVFKGVVAQLMTLFSPSGWIKLIVNAVCGWRLIKRAFDYIDMAKKEKDDMIRANYRGRSLANFLMVAAGLDGKNEE